jgi:hypothetical protein
LWFIAAGSSGTISNGLSSGVGGGQFPSKRVQSWA